MGERSGFGIVSDVKKVKVELSDFPMLCETCLGDSPYIRMLKEPLGKECRICSRPYSGFRWRPGLTARHKTTIVCQGCAKLKNVCQTCLFDLEYGLPVQVRDRFLKEAGADVAINIPESKVGRDFVAAYQMNEERLPYGQSEDVNARLARFARYAPYYKRNRPRICTFWQRGECSRGNECPFLHEDPDHDEALANQNIKDRFMGENDPVAEKILRRQHLDTDDPTIPPKDPTITTLFLGGIKPPINEIDIHAYFSAYGTVKSVSMIPHKCCSFVTYADRSSAEEAMKAAQGLVTIKETPIKLSWGKPKTVTISNQPISNNDIFADISFDAMNPQRAEFLK